MSVTNLARTSIEADKGLKVCLSTIVINFLPLLKKVLAIILMIMVPSKRMR